MAQVEAAKQRAKVTQQEQERQRSHFKSILGEFKASEANIETRAMESNKPGVASRRRKRQKLQSPTTKSNAFSNDAAEFIRLKQEYNVAVDTILSLQNNLRERETEAELAAQKLKNREGDLRDVIQRYKDLHEEYKKFLTLDDPYSPNNAHVKLIQERDAARWKVSEMEGELRQAKGSVTSAVTKQNLAKQHLRDVIFQYKTLQREHEALVQQIEGLRVDLPSSNASSSSSSRSQKKNSSVWRSTSSITASTASSSTHC